MYWKHNTEKLKFKINQKKIRFREFDIEKSKKDSNYVIRINDIYIHSKYDPIKEAKRFVKKNITNQKDIFLVGFGMGYVVEEILKLDIKLSVLVVNPDIFSKTLEIRNLDKALRDENLKIIFGEDREKLTQNLKKEISKIENSDFLIYQPALKIMDERFEKLKDIIENINITRKSFDNHKEIISDNMKNNVEDIVRSVGVNRFKNVFKDKPVFIIAAGPSLNKNIQELKKVKDRGIIISTGTALKPLINESILPDFLVAIDGLDNIYNQINEFSYLNIPVIFVPGVNKKMLSCYNRYRIVGFTADDILYEKLNNILDKGFIKSGGSVAHAGLDFASIVGGHPLVFVGQDLAVGKKGETHAIGTARQNEKKQKFYKMVEDINGKQIPTLKNLYFYLRWIEKYIDDNPEKTFIDATEGGAKINGSQILDLSKTIEKYCIKPIDKTKIKKIIEDYEENRCDELIYEIKNLIK